MDESTANRLLELQRVDALIDSLGLRLERSSTLEELRCLEKSVKKLEQDFAEHMREVSELQRYESKLDTEIGVIEQKAEEIKAQLFGGEIRSSRELTALQRELKNLEEKKASLEGKLLETLLQLDEFRSTTPELEKDLQLAREKLHGLRDAWEKESSKIQEEIASLQRQRELMALSIPITVIESYERLSAHMGGVAVARVDGIKCTGCNVDLSKAALEELAKAEEELPRCENCGRIIVTVSP